MSPEKQGMDDQMMGERIWSRFEKAYAEVLLVNDVNSPRRIGLMKRGPTQDRFPNQYTGTGGVLEQTDADPITGVQREWDEEIGVGRIDPQEFGRMIIDGKRIVFLFFVRYPEENMPTPHPQDGVLVGELEWVSIEEILSKDLVVTTRCFLEEWKKRNWSTTQSFTVFLERDNPANMMSVIKTVEVREGLVLE